MKNYKHFHSKKMEIKSLLILIVLLCTFSANILFAEDNLISGESPTERATPSRKGGSKDYKNATDASLTGHVINLRTGAHIPHVTIMFKGTTIGCVTDATGHFTMRNLPIGTFTVIAKHFGYQTVEKEISLEKRKIVELNFELEEQAIEMGQIVVTATRHEAEQKEVPVIVNVLSGKMFENTSSNTLAEGAAFQPGVRVEYGCANCGLPQLLINGLQGEYSQILLNSRAIFSSLAAVYNIEQLPAGMIDRVEVIRGGGSALFGSNAIAGVVNIITKEPLYNSLYISNSLNILKNGSIDNNVTFGGAFVSDDQQTGLYLYGAAKDRQKHDRDGDGFSELPMLSTNSLGFKLTHNTGVYSKLIVDYHRINEFRRGGNNFDKQPHESDIAEQLRHKINGGGVQYDIFSENQHHYLSLYTSGQLVERESYFGTGKNLDAYGNTEDRTLVGGAQYIFTGETPIVLPYEFTIGTEWNYNHILDKMLGYNRELEQTVNIYGIYLQNEWKSKDVNFIIGGRLDKHELINKVIFTPRTSVRYTPIEGLGLRASYSSGYRAPQIYNEDLHVGAVGGEVSLVKLDPDLRPEYSNSFSLSADIYKSFSNNIQTNLLVEGFYTSLDDVFSLVSQGKDKDSNLIFMRTNASGATVKGINLEGIIGIPGTFDVQAGYTFQNSRYKEAESWSEDTTIAPQKRMFRSPDNYGYITATAYLTDHIKASVFGKYTGSMLVQHLAGYIEKDEEMETPAFFDIGIKLNYMLTLSHSLTLHLSGGVKNVFDQFQKDIDVGPNRDAGFIYGPLYPRTYFIDIKFDIK